MLEKFERKYSVRVCECVCATSKIATRLRQCWRDKREFIHNSEVSTLTPIENCARSDHTDKDDSIGHTNHC